MKFKSFSYVRERLQDTHPRTRKAHLNTILGIVIKGGGMLISLLLVPLTIDYLSKEIYGTWLTISSIVTMLTFLDIGIGNGLRNKFSEAVSKQDTTLAQSYVSTAYVLFGIIQFALTVFFLLVFRYIPWQRVFNTDINVEQLQVVVAITVITMAIKLVLDILSYILFAMQESSQAGLITLGSNILTLLGTYMLIRITSGSLIYLAAVTVISPIVALLIGGFWLYRGPLNVYRPTFRLAKLKYARSLLGLGYKFFFVQLAVIVLFYTDNLIITQLFGPSEVTTYNVAFRYFNAASTLFAIAITPYWSAFTEASVKGDTLWMQKTHQYLQQLWLGLVIVVALMILASNTIYAVWVGSRVEVPIKLSICMGVFIIISCYNSIIASVINGLGKVRLQLYYALFSAVINVPLAILLGKMLNMGSAGVILGTSISLLACSVLGNLQAQKLISGTANGIWNQ
ncbi:oligosaccharide flippase family protein [Spirosoma areae]